MLGIATERDIQTNNFTSRLVIQVLVILSGIASLSWEVLWQIRSSLALGVSAYGTAITLAVTMGGMSIGSLASGYLLRNRSLIYPTRFYGTLEFIIGLCGLCLGIAFRAIEKLDTSAYAAWPGSAPAIHIFAIVLSLGIPSICMGATFPIFGLLARRFQTSLALLYGLNTFGAALGVLFTAFTFIPLLGLAHTAQLIAGLNIGCTVAAFLFGPGEREVTSDFLLARVQRSLSPAFEVLTVTITGFSIFALEIAWFRSLTAAFHSTTTAFAGMLATVLAGLSIGATLVPFLKEKRVTLGMPIGVGGALVLAMTPIIERFDTLVAYNSHFNSLPARFLYSFMLLIAELLCLGSPMALLGIAFPWIINEQQAPRRWGLLYGVNTLAAIAGSIGTAWLLLPYVGFARTSWCVGGLIVVTGTVLSPPQRKPILAGFGIVGLLLAFVFEAGIGKTHVQGWFGHSTIEASRIFEFYEGPEATVSAVDLDGDRALIVDGFVTATQQQKILGVHYMPWMGHLPMLLQPHPGNALVICFGTGQTANAVRQENPQSLDIVDINPRIFKLAHNFSANENVLGDPRVKAIVMDGRAYMRRTTKIYNVITLEPMPPTFAGVNALYSKEFYELARQKLTAEGTIAQWLPFHLVAPRYAASIAKTFQSVFPNSVLWIDPVSGTGILLGSKSTSQNLMADWPGFVRPGGERDLSEQQVRQAIRLNPEQLQTYAKHGSIITDDNQLLAYGDAVIPRPGDLQHESTKLIEQISNGSKNTGQNLSFHTP